MKPITLATAALATVIPLAAHPLAARQAAARADAPVSGDAVAEAVRKAVRENYVVPEVRAALDRALASGIAAGRYRIGDPQRLAEAINADMAAVAHDKHLGLRHDPGFAAQIGTRRGDEETGGAYFTEFARTHNHGVIELKLLAGNIRYMRYDGFLWTGADSAAALDTAMRYLKGGDAAIIDLRFNGGGSPEAVRRLASYFLPANTPLVTFELRSDPPEKVSSEAVPADLRLSAMPVYVLTGSHTASAAEEFASHVAAFGFGKLVGETSAGAAYRNEFFAIPGGYVLSVSIGRPILARTGGNWEGKGVAPALPSAFDAALDRAQQDAFATLAAKASGPRRAAARLGMPRAPRPR